MTKTSTKSDKGLSLQQKIVNLRSEMQASLVERDDEVDVVLVSLLCGEHPLLVGPPGTAKSMLLDMLMHAVVGAEKFSILVNKFTTPEEVFGPISVQGLKQDVYRRVTTGKLPEADISFVDEIFKASTAILNTMLKILNERTYCDGGGVRQCPLLMCVAASNEFPDDQNGGKELAALFDRFLIRKIVKPIQSPKGMDRLLWSDMSSKVKTHITRSEIDNMQQEVEDIDFDDSAKEAFHKIVDTLRKEGIHPGDRRLRKSVKTCKAHAYLMESDVVFPDHLTILSHVLWDDPVDHPDKAYKVVMKLANPVRMEVIDTMLQAENVVNTSAPMDACSKLKELLDKLQKMRTITEGDRVLVQNSAGHLQKLIKATYNKGLGFNPGE